MKKMMLLIITLAMLSGSALCAQDISGDWQGTLHAVQGPLRTILKISKADNGGWSAMLYSIDQSPNGMVATSVMLEGSTFKYAIDPIRGSYEGKLSADGNSITGFWTQGNGPRQLDLVRATKETAWALPDPNWGHTQVAVDPKIFDSYVGRYELPPNFLITITRDSDHLYSQGQGQEPFELFPTSEKEYFATDARIEVSFHTNEQGKATEIVVHQGGRDTTAKRIAGPTAASLSAKTAAIDAMAASAFAQHPMGSMTVGVVAGNRLVWTKSYGNADMEKKVPADKDTVYRIGSITKMFTAVMLEQLADAGKVHLSDPAEKYFPEVKAVQGRYPDAPPITLIELATHTAGFDREPGDTETYVQGPVAEWEKTLIAALAHTRYAYEPGTRFFYSNIGFATLGATLARAAGQPYVEYVSKNIFAPLGMTHTALERTPEMLPHLSKGYQVAGGNAEADTAEREHENGRGYKVPNGAIYTTVGDMANFVSFLLGHGPDSVLKVASLERNLTQLAVPANYDLTQGYALGGMVIRRGNYIAFGHGGAVAGYLAGVYMNRRAVVGVIALSNAAGGEAVNPDDLALSALDLLSK